MLIASTVNNKKDLLRSGRGDMVLRAGRRSPGVKTRSSKTVL